MSFHHTSDFELNENMKLQTVRESKFSKDFFSLNIFIKAKYILC